MKLKLYIVLLILLIGFNISYAQDKTIVSGDTFAFQWDQNVEPDLAGYRCYLSMNSGVYDTTPSNAYAVYGLVSQSPNHSITIPGLYFFVLTAYDIEGFQSDISDEASLLVTAPTAPTAPINLRFVGMSAISESVIYKDTIYAEFKQQEDIEYEPKETIDE